MEIGNLIILFNNLSVWSIHKSTPWSSMPLKLVNLSFYADVIIAPVVLHIPAILAANTQKDVKVAAQNSSNYGFGAFTG